LKSTGKGACILPHGVLFRGNAEADIRRNLIRKGYIKGIIGLPANLFYGTGIPACILVIDKEHAQARKGIFMIDASAGYMKDGPKNRLRDQDIHKIVDVFNKQTELPRYARMVPLEEIEKNDFNLNLPRYIDSQQSEDMQDIAGHLQGGIPEADVQALDSYWAVCPKLQQSLFKKNRKGYLDLKVDKADIKKTIYEHPEFTAFIDGMNQHFAAWREKTSKTLKALKPGFHPKQLAAKLSESLLEHYRPHGDVSILHSHLTILDAYDIYQHLMDYWSATMQDDCYAIAADGWKAEPMRIIELDKKNGKQKDKGWACDLIPKSLIVAKYFAKEQVALDTKNSELESLSSKMAEIEEEHGGEEGLLSELEKINKANVAARIKELKGDKEAKEELAVLTEWLDLNTQESDLKKQVKDLEIALDTKSLAQYAKLSEADVKSLVVDYKWLATINTDIHSEMDRISQTLTQRVKELAERYDKPLPVLAEQADAMEFKVRAHLERMGFTW
jgi:type I restriction enzyme M protein